MGQYRVGEKRQNWLASCKVFEHLTQGLREGESLACADTRWVPLPMQPLRASVSVSVLLRLLKHHCQLKSYGLICMKLVNQYI